MSVRQRTSAAPSDSPDKMLSRRDAAAYLGITRWTLWSWQKRHYGPPFYRIGGRLRYKVRDLDKWLEARRQR